MKIELFALNGSFAHSSIAVRCLATAVREAGFTAVHITEATLHDRTEGVLARLVAANADLYGFSCYIWSIDEMLALAADLKALCPACRIVLGGPEVSFDTARFERLPYIDTVITGEGEEAIVTLARMLQAGETPPKLLAGTPDGHFATRGIHYDVGEPITSLVYYESARGCPYSCAFCLSSATEGVRAKSAERALADLLAFEKFEKPFTVKLVDRTFNFDRARAKAIWQGLLSPAYTKCYHFEISAALLDEESLEILAKFPPGKIRLEIGLQSTNAETLGAISRHTDAAAVLAAARRLKAMGNVHVHLDLIAGLPFEDYRSFARSFDEAYFCCDILQLGFLKLLHGTALRRDAEKYGIRCAARAPYTVLATNWLSFEELHRLHGIAALLDRLCERGRFVHTLSFLLPRVPSPFGFYEGFLDYLEKADGKDLQRISQRDLFSHLAAYGKGFLDSDEINTFIAYLQADFSAAEVRKPPKF